jgi:flagellar protein FlgJ
MITPLPNDATFDTRSLDKLKYSTKNDPENALKAAAKEMEGLFVQMMLKSMRDAGFKDGLFNSQQTDMFTSMYDQQLSRDIAAQGGIGLAEVMFRQLSGEPWKMDAQKIQGDITAPVTLARKNVQTVLPTGNTNELAAIVEKSRSWISGDNFISRIISSAVETARKSGIPHQIIIAQAALESGWGKKEIPTTEGTPSYNLFGIKASSDWKGKTSEITTTEFVDGIAKKVKAKFKVYESYAHGLDDYTRLLTNNPRYEKVVGATSPNQAAHNLQASGYATDPNYAKKLIKIIERIDETLGKTVKQYQSDVSSLF